MVVSTVVVAMVVLYSGDWMSYSYIYHNYKNIDYPSVLQVYNRYVLAA